MEFLLILKMGILDGVLLICNLHTINQHGKRFELCEFMHKECTKTSQVWPLMLKLLPSAQKGTATHASYFIEVPCCLFISKVINNYVRPRVSLTEALAH